MRCLIVDDDPVSRLMIRGYLAPLFDCDVVQDGASAVSAHFSALQKREPYDLLCLDIVMPGLNGFQVLQAIKDRESELKIPRQNRIKIVTISGCSRSETAEQALSTGVDAHLNKPLSRDELFCGLREGGLLDDGMIDVLLCAREDLSASSVKELRQLRLAANEGGLISRLTRSS